MTPGLHEPRDEAAESSHGPQSGDVQLLPEPLDAAARGDPVSGSHSQQDRYFNLRAFFVSVAVKCGKVSHFLYNITYFVVFKCQTKKIK